MRNYIPATESVPTAPDPLLHIPKTLQQDIRQAVRILKDAGCTQVFLFGSLATGQIKDTSDIDLAIRGCPKGRFFHLVGQLLLNLEHPVDLVSLDRQDAFACYLEQTGDLLRVG